MKVSEKDLLLYATFWICLVAMRYLLWNTRYCYALEICERSNRKPLRTLVSPSGKLG